MVFGADPPASNCGYRFSNPTQPTFTLPAAQPNSPGDKSLSGSNVYVLQNGNAINSGQVCNPGNNQLVEYWDGSAWKSSFTSTQNNNVKLGELFYPNGYQLYIRTIQTNQANMKDVLSGKLIRQWITCNNGYMSCVLFGVSPTNVTSVSLTPTSVDEHQSVGTVVGTLSATGLAGSSYTYTLVSGTGSTDNSQFTISGSQVKTAAVFHYPTKSSYSILVKAVDNTNTNFFAIQQFTITVNDLVYPPSSLSLSNNQVNDDSAVGTFIGTFSATDPDVGTSFSYAFSSSSSNDNNLFTLNGNSLSTKSTYDAVVKNSYTIYVTVTNRDSQTLTKAFTIVINHINRAPTDLNLSPQRVNENQPVGTYVGTMSGVDADTGSVFTYSFGVNGADNSLFQIDGSVLRTNAQFDYQVKNTYNIVLKVTDEGGLSFSKPFVITIDQVLQPPTQLTLSGNTAHENVASGQFVGSLSSFDGRKNPSFTYQLIDHTDKFSISGNSLSTNAVLNYDLYQSVDIKVTVTNDQGLTYTRSFTINIIQDKCKNVVCVAQDACHVAGVCDQQTGFCSNPNAQNGITCDDGNLCSGSSSCSNGFCTGNDWVNCTAQDNCHSPGQCNPNTGACSVVTKPDNTYCDYPDHCVAAYCITGVCTPKASMQCTPVDQCHMAGQCASGLCENLPLNGTSCDDSDKCTTGDYCNQGVCTGTKISGCVAEVWPPYILLTETTSPIVPTHSLWIPIFFQGKTNLTQFHVRVTNFPTGGDFFYNFGYMNYPREANYTMPYKKDGLDNNDIDYVAVKLNPPQFQEVQDIVLNIEVSYTRANGVTGIGNHVVVVPILQSAGDFNLNTQTNLGEFVKGTSTWISLSFAALSRLLNVKVTLSSEELQFGYPSEGQFTSLSLDSFINVGETDFVAVRIDVPSDAKNGTHNIIMHVEWDGAVAKSSDIALVATIVDAEVSRDASEISTTYQAVNLKPNSPTWSIISLASAVDDSSSLTDVTITVLPEDQSVSIRYANQKSFSVVDNIGFGSPKYGAFEVSGTTQGDFNADVYISYTKNGVAKQIKSVLVISIDDSKLEVKNSAISLTAGSNSEESISYTSPEDLLSIKVQPLFTPSGWTIQQTSDQANPLKDFFAILKFTTPESKTASVYNIPVSVTYTTTNNEVKNVIQPVVVNVKATPEAQVPSSPPSTPFTPTPTPTPSSPTVSGSPVSDGKSSGLSVGATAGIAVGVIGGVAIAAAVTGLIIHRRRKSRIHFFSS